MSSVGMLLEFGSGRRSQSGLSRIAGVEADVAIPSQPDPFLPASSGTAPRPGLGVVGDARRLGQDSAAAPSSYVIDK